MGGVFHVNVFAAQAEESRIVQEKLRQPDDMAGNGGRKHIAVELAPGQEFLDLDHVGIKAH